MFFDERILMRLPSFQLPSHALLEATAIAGALALSIIGGFFLSVLLAPISLDPGRLAQLEHWVAHQAHQQEAAK